MTITGIGEEESSRLRILTLVTAKVVALATLNEGYIFDTTLDGNTIAVTVPPGGVKEGDQLFTLSFAHIFVYIATILILFIL